MADRFTIDVFPAQRGDAFLVEYGQGEHVNRILIDGGITRTARTHLIHHLSNIGDHELEALVVTHIDQDHIQGIVTLLEQLPTNVTIGQVLFNGEKHLPIEPMGVADALRLAEVLEAHHAQAWDVGTGTAICVNDDGTPRQIKLPGGMRLTILSPNDDKLRDLATDWQATIEAMGAGEDAAAAEPQLEEADILGFERMGADDLNVVALAESDFKEDDAAPNGSSIAFLMEFAGKRALMLADAHPGLILKSLRQISPNEPLHVDCVKLSHHGSRRNTSLELAQALISPAWIISSNGAQTKHPNREAIARVLHGSPGNKFLYFNYQTQYNEIWANEDLWSEHGYRARFGDGESVQRIDLFAPEEFE